MSVRGIGNFASGLADGFMAGRERKERRETNERIMDLQEQLAAAPRSTGATGATDATMPPPAQSRGITGRAAPSAGGAGSDFFSLLDRTEGGGSYSTLFGHSQKEGGRFGGVDVSRMTLGQLRDFASPRGEYGQWVRGQVGRVATPMGRYQTVGTTLFNVANELGLSDDTVFDARTQDRIGMHLAQRRIRSANTLAGQRAALRAEWEGFRNVSDAELDRAIASLVQNS